MRHGLILFIILFTSIVSYAQEYDLSGMQGLQNDKGDVLLELSGYEILITTKKGQINNQKTVNSLKKEYDLKTILAEYSDESIGPNNKVIEAETEVKNRGNMKMNQVCFLLKKSEKEITVILFQTFNQRDVLLEKEVVNTYLETGLSDYILPHWNATTISFAGRDIHLGTACKWINPHNVHCKGGQISWSEFPSFESAMLDINTRIKANGSNKKTPTIYEEDIDIIFEEIPSLAHRVVYQTPSLYPLVVYYVVQEVRGRYISCTLSNYGYNRNDYELAPLLQQIISIPEIPEEAYNEFDIPEREVYIEEVEKVYDINFWNIQAGAWLPLGNLKNVFEVAPSLGFYMGIPIKNNMAIDLGFNIAFPTNRKQFNYYFDKNDKQLTKTDLMIGVSLRWRYQKELAKNIYWTTYLGAGMNSLKTELEKYDYEDEEDKWHYVETMDLLGGTGIRYKKVGFFIEYHYTPYSIAGKMRKHLGNSAVNVGLSLSF